MTPPEPREIRLDVDASASGQRLDRFLAEALGLSRGYVRRLIAGQRIFVGGHHAVKGALLRAGDSVVVLPFRPPENGPIPEPDRPLEVIRDEGGLVAVEKPAGIPTHPLDFDETGTLTNAFLGHYPEALGIGPRRLEPGLVHRLDTQTSGVVLFAKDGTAFASARSAFEAREVDKLYTARVHGELTTRGEVRLRFADRGRQVSVVANGGRAGILHVDTITPEPESSTSRVELRLVTGVRHQIRATLAHLGHPVVGDTLYGSPTPLERHLLHATELRLGDFTARSDPSPLYAAPIRRNP